MKNPLKVHHKCFIHKSNQFEVCITRIGSIFIYIVSQ